MKFLFLILRFVLLIFFISFGNIAMAEVGDFIPMPSDGKCPSDHPNRGSIVNPLTGVEFHVCTKEMIEISEDGIIPTSSILPIIGTATSTAPKKAKARLPEKAKAMLPAFADKRLEIGFAIPGGDPAGSGVMTHWVPCTDLFYHERRDYNDVCAVLGMILGGQLGAQAGLRIPVKEYLDGRIVIDFESLIGLGVHFRPLGGSQHVAVPLTAQADFGVNINPPSLENDTIRAAFGLGMAHDLNRGQISDATFGVTPSLSIAYQGDGVDSIVKAIGKMLAPKAN